MLATFGPYFGLKVASMPTARGEPLSLAALAATRRFGASHRAGRGARRRRPQEEGLRAARRRAGEKAVTGGR
jgi:hypothetical protein